MQFYFIGEVSGGSKNQSVSGVTTICLTQCNTSPSHKVDQVVDCGLWSVGSLLFNGCAKLLDIGRNLNTLSYTPIQSIPNMLNGVTCPVSMLAMQELGCVQLPLCTDPCNMGPCIIMLQHELIVVDEWHNNGPQDLVTVSLWIKNAINKMHRCSLSITYACPYHNPTTTQSTSLTSANRSPTQRHTRCLPSALYSENRDSSPKTVSDSLCRNSLVMQTNCCSSCPGDWSQTILEVKMLDVEVLGWCGLRL